MTRHEDRDIAEYKRNDEQANVSGGEQKLFHCVNCDIKFFWSPTIIGGKTFCCTGCAAGGPCCCDYSQYPSVNISGVIHYDLDEEALKESSDRKTS